MSKNLTMTSQLLDDIELRIGRAFCRGDDFAIFHADCVEAMRAFPAECFDLTITSPPYNIGKEYEAPLELSAYLTWCERWLTEIHRLTRHDGAFWLNLGYVAFADKAKAIPLPYLLWNRCPFFLVQEIVWNYGAGVAGKRFLSPRNEKFLWYVKDQNDYCFNLDVIRDPDVKYPRQKKNGKLRCNTIGKNPSDVWQIAKVTSGENRASPERAPHPAQFPMDLIKRIVLGFSDERDMVLDPFLGSGTTAEVCIANKRAVVGFEIRREYCQYAAKRLKAAAQKTRSVLFDV